MMTDLSEAQRPRPADGTDAGRMPGFKRVRYQQLLDAGLAELQKQDYEAIKVTEIARAAGLAKATLYSYFASKDHLYAVIFRQWAEQEPRRPAPPADPGLARARERAAGIIAAVERRPQFYKLNVSLSASTEPEVQAELSAVGARTRRLFSGDFAAAGVASPQDAAGLLQAVIHSVLSGAVRYGASFADAYRLADRFIDLYEHPADHQLRREAGPKPARPHVPAPLTGDQLAAYRRKRWDRIVAAATAALREQPYEQIPVADIAQSAQVALGTLYRYFSSKEQLYAAVLLKWFQGSRFLAAFADLPAEERIRARVEAAIDAFEADPRFFKAVTFLQSARDESVQAVLGEMAFTGKAVLLEDFRTIGTVEPDDAATLLWAIINSLATGVIYYNGTFPETRRLVGEFITLISASASSRG